MRRGLPVAAIALMLSMATSAALAERPPQGPYYDPGTKSYFELRYDNIVVHGADHRALWKDAKRHAAQRSYKGRRGRLAIVRTPETLDFIRQHFHVYTGSWIGLTFYCSFHKLIWIDGSIESFGRKGMWYKRWNRYPKMNCSNLHKLVLRVYLTPDKWGGVFWQAVPDTKYFTGYFIEYPAADTSADNDPAGGKKTSAAKAK